MTDRKNLFEEFPAVNTEKWISEIERFLKGKSTTSLSFNIDTNLSFSPLNRSENSTPQYLGTVNLQSQNNWHICEEIETQSFTDGELIEYKKINSYLLESLRKGANALVIILHKLPSAKELETLLEGVLFDLIPVHFKGLIFHSLPAEFLTNLSKTTFASKIHGSCDLSNNSEDKLIDCLDICLTCGLNLRPINITINNNSTEQLSYAIFKTSRWIDLLLEKGKSIGQIITNIRFEYNVGTDYFIEIASIRALKKLWFGMLEAYKVEKPYSPYIHAITQSNQNENQYKNMVVATTQTMSAAIGGVNSIYVLPSDKKNKTNEFSRRIARNVQHILQSETHLNRVIDPAAGSYYLENLTIAIAEKAWEKFCKL
ncbi:MAG: methylmalonyl-CoA mutase family protein [Saprospiraceae bacterium]|nr:methylmalonyl-CoA mutase family protein [Saprospiraceae bacterium]